MVERNLPKVDTRVRFPSPAPFLFLENSVKEANLELEQSIKTLTTLIDRSTKAQLRLLPGSSQHTLLKNRIQALQLVKTLLMNKSNVRQLFTKEDLEAAHAPLLSLISKSEKAILNLRPDMWQYSLLAQNINVLRIGLPLLESALNEYRH